MRGVSLVELMIAMALGLLLLGACGYFYLASLTSTQSTLSVSRVQESGRLAMELIGHDIRGAGDLLCDNRRPVANLLAERDRPFWGTLGEPLKGALPGSSGSFEDPVLASGSAAGQRLPDGPALRLWTVVPLAIGATGQVASNQPIPIAGNQPPAMGAPLLLCDFGLTALVRVTGTGGSIGHAAPANCTDHFSIGTVCPAEAPAEAAQHRFGVDTAFGLPRQVRWFVGNDERGTPSLYRQELVDGQVTSGGAVLAGVSHFSLRYLVEGNADYVTAEQISDSQWGQVRAVHVQLKIEALAGTGVEPGLSRVFQQTYSVRSRLQ
ncbi:PilW family protein [Stenotrophomonas sp. C1657]|uniref:PilW family protein n=1 Tax=Stenotrophomonas sp. C1657 TaxID=3077844 RepID=UPI00293CF356|nr:PilW family protein [Stenotrophomonas sp. C1657]MDV3514571.1 PilW family protein [Stenotrophomonas sp. C1657]